MPTQPTNHSPQPSVLFLAGEYPPRPGGVGDYTAHLAAHLAAQGVRVTILATREPPPTPPLSSLHPPTPIRPSPPDPHPSAPSPQPSPQPSPSDTQPLTLSPQPSPPDTQHSALSTQHSLAHSALSTQHSIEVWRAVDHWDWRCASTVLVAIRAVDADLVHVQYQPAAFDMAAAVCWLPGWVRRRCPGVRTLVTFHDLRVPYLFPKAGPLRAAVRDRLLRGADAAIFTDPADWRAAAPVRPAGRHWVPIGSNLAVAPPPDYDRRRWRAAVGADNATPLVVHFGFLNRSKGLETLLDALRLLKEQGHPVKLLLVGAEAGATDPTNQTYAAEIERRLADPALHGLVHRLPLVAPDAVSAYLLAADLAAFPFLDGASLRRGSLLAALAHGLPTVSTGVRGRGMGGRGQGGSLSPGPRDGENLLLVPPGDAAALAHALGRLAGDEPLRARLAAGARALTDALGWPRIAAAHHRIYATLLAGD